MPNKGLVLGVLASALLVSPWLWGGTLHVTPVRIELSAAHTHTMVQITNVEAEPVTIQADILAWSYRDGDYLYAPTDEFLLNPPIFTLGSGQTQILRLGLRHPSEGTDELAYRLILEELPKPMAREFVGLQTLLRISIPIFLKPDRASRPVVVWNAQTSADGSVRVRAENRGNAHVQIRQLEVSSEEDEAPFVRQTLSEYMLPGQTCEWVIRGQRAGRPSRLVITALTDGERLREVVVARAP